MPTPQPPPLRFYSGARRFWMAMGVFALLAALAIALFYAEEDWRGARAWTSVQADLRAKGETLDWHSFVQPPIPDERNLAMAPFFVRELNYEVNPKTHTYTFGPGTRRPKDLDQMPFGNENHPLLKTASYELGRPTNLPGFQSYFRLKAGFPHPEKPGEAAADVLLALGRYGPALDELSRAAAERPLTRFPLDWQREEFWGLNLPHYNLEQNLVRALCLRASAQQALGDTAGAVRDLALGLRLCRDMRPEHMLIGHLVEITCLSMVLGEVWEGLAARRWSAAQIARLQTDLQGFEMLTDFADAMRFERATTIYNIDYLKRHHDAGLLLLSGSDQSGAAADAKRALGWLVPHGWFDANKAVICSLEQEVAVEAVEGKTHRVFPGRSLTGNAEWTAMQGSLRLVLAGSLLKVFDSITWRTARAQTAVDQAVTACALERFFLEHQVYPTRLDELVPVYLSQVPTDVIDGAPLRYHPAPDGRYVLYAVGWNGKDDGGRVEWDGDTRLDYKRGDWIWQYAELRRPPPGK